MRDSSAGVRQALGHVLLGLVVSLACVGLGEAILRQRAVERFYVLPPGLETVFYPSPELMPGIRGVSHFRTNEVGMRGDPMPAGDRVVEILTLGGSSTECLFLDQEETWPRLLERRLGEESGQPVWVGNVGRSGHDTRHHRFQAAELLDQFPDLDAVVLLVGVNDFLRRLAADESYRSFDELPPGERRAIRQSAFSMMPREARSGPVLARSEIWQRLRWAWSDLMGRFSPYVQDKSGDRLRVWRGHRRGSERLIERLPDLGPALAEYAASLEEILALAERRGVLPVVVSHPALWREDLDPRLESLLWMGGVGDYQARPGQPYYSAAALAAGLRQYNATAMEVCARADAVCIDLAAGFPRDTSVLYDDVHFNEGGARRVAEEIAAGLLASGPGRTLSRRGPVRSPSAP